MAVKVSLSFAKMKDGDLVVFVKEIINGITGNAAFPTPPVTMAALATARTDFADKIAAAGGGGKMNTAAKYSSRQSVLGDLRQLALYVQLNCNDDMPILLSSGFSAMSTDRASVALEKPDDVSVKNGNSGELVAKVKPVKNTSMYEIRAKRPDGTALDSAFSGDSRDISITGLTPGTFYTIQVRALGGKTGHSDWSDPVQHMSM